jgi:hypothetical protein
MAAGKGRDKLNPSGYVETLGVFAHRVAAAMRPGMECSVELASQTDFSEPLTRVNVDSAARYVGEWMRVMLGTRPRRGIEIDNHLNQCLCADLTIGVIAEKNFVIAGHRNKPKQDAHFSRPLSRVAPPTRA